MNILNKVVLSEVSAAETVTSDPIDVSQCTTLSLAGVVTGGSSPTGALKVQLSNYKLPALANSRAIPDDSWVDLANGSLSFTVAASKSTGALTICAQHARAAYTYSSGSGGTLSATFNARNDA